MNAEKYIGQTLGGSWAAASVPVEVGSLDLLVVNVFVNLEGLQTL